MMGTIRESTVHAGFEQSSQAMVSVFDVHVPGDVPIGIVGMGSSNHNPIGELNHR